MERKDDNVLWTEYIGRRFAREELLNGSVGALINNWENEGRFPNVSKECLSLHTGYPGKRRVALERVVDLVALGQKEYYPDVLSCLRERVTITDWGRSSQDNKASLYFNRDGTVTVADAIGWPGLKYGVGMEYDPYKVIDDIVRFARGEI